MFIYFVVDVNYVPSNRQNLILVSFMCSFTVL